MSMFKPTNFISENNLFVDKWEDLVALPRPCVRPMACYTPGKVFMTVSTQIFCFTQQTDSRSYIDVSGMYKGKLFFPQVYGEKMFVFPLVDPYEPWWLDFKPHRLRVMTHDMNTEDTDMIPCIKGLEFGGNVIVCNRKFYTINVCEETFVEGDMDDFKKFKVLGEKGKAGQDAVLVALPNYPAFKC